MIYLTKNVKDIRNASVKIEKTLAVLESMRDGDHCGDLEEMVSDLSSALDSLNRIPVNRIVVVNRIPVLVYA